MTFPVEGNILLAARTQQRHCHQHAQNRALKLLASVGLENRANSRVQDLSGGERGIAITALIGCFKLVLADEPDNLDPTTGHTIRDLLLEQCRQQHQPDPGNPRPPASRNCHQHFQ